MSCKEDVLPLLDTGQKIHVQEDGGTEEHRDQHHQDSSSDNNNDTLPAPSLPFDIESSVASTAVRVRQQQHGFQQRVARPSRGLRLATPTPREPITDPFAFVCEFAQRPKFGHMYVLCPERRRRSGDRGVGLSVGPHWAGVIYTISMIGVIALFVANVLVGPDVAPWCQPVIVACSTLTILLLIATAVTDPGIVVESAESAESGSCGYCEECSIWTPQGAEHCEECGVCIFGLDHHCPWMGKCIGRGNIWWFRLFNGSWILFLSLLMVGTPWINSHKESSR